MSVMQLVNSGSSPTSSFRILVPWFRNQGKLSVSVGAAWVRLQTVQASQHGAGAHTPERAPDSSHMTN